MIKTTTPTLAEELEAGIDEISARALHLCSRIREHARTLALEEPLPALAQLLTELALSEEDCRGHFLRYAEAMGSVRLSEQSEPCREDWYRCSERREAAIAGLIRYSIAFVARDEARSAAPEIEAAPRMEIP